MCGVSRAWVPEQPGTKPPVVEFQAIWDTGATLSVITQAVVDACDLKPTGMTHVASVHGEQDVETYLVNIALPNQVMVTGVTVTKGILKGDVHILIGMDVISGGDFAVTNHDGFTQFSFRSPSQEHIDFVPPPYRPNRAERRRRKKTNPEGSQP